MVGTWTPPGAIFTFAFDDEKLTLELIKRTPIPQNEPVSWITFDVSQLWLWKPILDVFDLQTIGPQLTDQ